MALVAGLKIGPYQVVNAIGAGGMGEVYRARDLRLNREVAVKVLPASFSSDPVRLRRFEQEALAAAALNHPNILAVYDVGQQDGSPYLVSELLEGEVLRERLRNGPISPRKALDYAIQIARGLAAAHEKGIVHRDLKPDNIFITKDGRLKILDFGLAKLTRPESLDSDQTIATGIPQSDPGTALGTVGYMSPEQVRGKATDQRSDLFSFGATLYEMVSGKRAFQGDSPADTMSAILHSEPPELAEVNRNVPPALERIVRHCLEKAPEERFQSAGDIAFDLESIQTASGTAVTKRGPSGRKRLIPLFALMVIVLVGFAAFLLGRQSRSPRAPVVFHRITYERGSVISARFAADGHSVIYDGAWEGKPPHLFSTPATLPEPRALDLENAHLFGVSRSGEAALGIGGRIANHLAVLGSTLARSPLGGGAPRELLKDVAAADWSPNGGNLAVVHYTAGRTRLEYPIGTVLYETGGWIGDLHFSPAGDKLAFLDHRFWPDDRGWVAVVDLSGNKKTLTGEWEAEDGLAWAPGGKEIWFTATASGVDRSLYAVDLSGKQRLLLSIPGSLRLHDIYPDGRVLLSATHERVGMIGVSADSNKQHDLSWSGWTIVNDISPDGKTVVFSEESEFGGANYTLAVRTLDGSPPVKLSEGVVGRYSADGKSLTAVIADQPNHFTVLPTGAGEPKDMPVAGLTHLLSADFMPNGEFLVAGTERGHGSRCFVRSVDGASLKAVTPEGQSPCRLSPNFKYVAASDSIGEIGIFPMDGSPGHTLQGTAGMFPITWADNHSILAYPKGECPGRLLQIDAFTAKQRFVRDLAPPDLAGVSQLQNVVTTPDGRHAAYSVQQVLDELYVVENLK